MKPNQKMKNASGIEVILFPCDVLNITQGENGQWSHQQTLNIDYVGLHAWYPSYAPVSCKCVDIWDRYDNNRVFQSLNKVLFADGSVDYLTFSCMHDDNPIANVGDTFTQGTLLFHTGMHGNVTGDHSHVNFAKGTYKGYQQHASGQWDLINSTNIYKACYINDTRIINDLGYPFKIYDGKTSLTGLTPLMIYACMEREENLKCRKIIQIIR